VITKEEYLKALEIVEAYHLQINEISSLILKGDEIRISHLINDEKTPTRIAKILDAYRDEFGDVLVQDVERRRFLMLRLSGQNTWKIFIDVRNKKIKI
jgi:hypothetical protein